MGKKIAGIIAMVIVIAAAVYFKFGYINSQWQLKHIFRSVAATPVTQFYSATEPSCGIWYQHDEEDLSRLGKANAEVKDCFRKAFVRCSSHNILMVRYDGNSASGRIAYSLIRILRSNDQGKCLIQNYVEEYPLDVKDGETRKPLGYINTCTTLAEDFASSCEPLYITEQRAANK